MYLNDFNDALKMSADQNLVVPNITQSYEDEKLIEDTILALLKEYKKDEFKGLIGQCIEVSYRLYIGLKDVGIESYLTIGSIIHKKYQYEFFPLESRDIVNMLTLESNGNKKIHVWITLPSLKIIDLTFLSSYVYLNNIKDPLGLPIYNFPDNLPDFKYIPKIVGEDFLYKIGAIKILDNGK